MFYPFAIFEGLFSCCNWCKDLKLNISQNLRFHSMGTVLFWSFLLFVPVIFFTFFHLFDFSEPSFVFFCCLGYMCSKINFGNSFPCVWFFSKKNIFQLFIACRCFEFWYLVFFQWNVRIYFFSSSINLAQLSPRNFFLACVAQKESTRLWRLFGFGENCQN